MIAGAVVAAPSDFGTYVEMVRAMALPAPFIFSIKTLASWFLVYHYINGMRHMVSTIISIICYILMIQLNPLITDPFITDIGHNGYLFQSQSSGLPKIWSRYILHEDRVGLRLRLGLGVLKSMLFIVLCSNVSSLAFSDWPGPPRHEGDPNRLE